MWRAPIAIIFTTPEIQANLDDNPKTGPSTLHKGRTHLPHLVRAGGRAPFTRALQIRWAFAHRRELRNIGVFLAIPVGHDGHEPAGIDNAASV